MTMHPDPDHFDRTLRAHYLQAADHLPGPLRLQLTPAMAAQRRGFRSPARWQWPAATAFASLALVLGLWWSPLQREADDSAATAVAAASAETPVDNDDGTELLVRNPDFYAWLGSEEARTLALE